MLTKYVDLLRQEFSKEQAYNHVAEICQHHRIQASPGHRNAASYCFNMLAKAGLEAEVLRYAGDGKTRYWEYLMPQEWVASKAILELIEPDYEVLANYDNIPMSLIQRSATTPKQGIEAELVILDNGDEEEKYQNIDFQGKLVMTDGDYDHVREWAVEKRGAIGIITDRMIEFPPIRHRYDMGDALTYTSFWWSGHEKKCFGFVLSPKAGAKLRKRAKQGEKIHLKATVEAKFYDGEIEVVSGLIRGKSNKEIIVVAHLCHPQPSANDNASGCGVVLETARAIMSLINKNKITELTHSIRFLLLPEMSGTYAFLANNEELIPNIIAALNLDMVGENQEICHSSLIAEQPPHACGHFAGDLIELALEAVSAEVPNLAGTAKYALFRHTVSPFSGGSDHYIFSDPTVGIGAPMIIQWPDKYYHTSMDTIDKVDPEMLKRVALLTGSYALLVCCAKEHDVIFLAKRMASLFKKTVDSYLDQQLVHILQFINQNKSEKALKVHKKAIKHLNYLLDIKKAQFYTLQRILANKVVDSLIEKLNKQILNYVENSVSDWNNTFAHLLEINNININEIHLPPKQQNEYFKKAALMVPQRLSRGPISLRGRINLLPASLQSKYNILKKTHSSDMSKLTYLLYWMNGERTLAEIIDLVEHETNTFNEKVAVFLVNMLEEMNLVKINKL